MRAVSKTLEVTSDIHLSVSIISDKLLPTAPLKGSGRPGG